MKKHVTLLGTLALFVALVFGGESVASKAGIESALQTQFSGFTGPAAPTLVWSKTATAIHTGVVTGSTGAPAVTGEIGEVVSFVRVRSAATAVTTDATCNLGATTCPSTGGTQSFVLAPGDWDCHGAMGFVGATTSTSVTAWRAGVATTSATLPPNDSNANPTNTNGEMLVTQTAAPTTGFSSTANILTIPNFQVRTLTNLTLFPIAQATFTVAGLSIFGFVQCRRMR